MSKQFRRKPSRKSIERTDKTSLRGDDHVELSRRVKSTNIKRDISEHSQKATKRGRVVSSKGRDWYVIEDGTQSNVIGEYHDTIACHVGGLVLTENEDDTTLIVVGDYVRYQPDETEPKGVIVEIEKRTSFLERKTAGNRSDTQVLVSNVDQAIIVHAAAEPFYSRRSIDRYLISADQGELSPILVINKIDLMVKQMLEEDLIVYSDILGIPVVFTSVEKNQGIEELLQLCAGKTSVIVGPSGVGKSSLVNAMFGEEIQLTGEISDKYQKGKHTTTTASLLALPDSGCLIDTPGLREFGVSNVLVEELPFFFHDFDEFYPNCKFLPCTHTHEPNCAVKAAVEEGLIDEQRYDSYLKILESLQ